MKKISYKFILSSLLIVIFSSFFSDLCAQYDVFGMVTKASGEKIHGEVLEYEPNAYVVMTYLGERVRIDLSGKNEFKFTSRKPPKPYRFPIGTGYSRIAVGLLNGTNANGGYLNYSYMHLKSRFFGYGGSMAYENYSDERGYDFIVPGAVVYSYFLESNASPFIRANVGYGIAIKNTSKSQVAANGGLNAGIVFGYRLSTNKLMIDTGIGFRYQKGDYEFAFPDLVEITNNHFKRFDFTVGFMW